jgi:hypothetical protein
MMRLLYRLFIGAGGAKPRFNEYLIYWRGAAPIYCIFTVTALGYPNKCACAFFQ